MPHLKETLACDRLFFFDKLKRVIVMDIDRKDVLHVADLARLALTDEETALYTDQLGKILSYVAKLSNLDTAETSPSAQCGNAGDGPREDVITPSLTPEDALQNAPEKGRRCFKVPRIIE